MAAPLRSLLVRAGKTPGVERVVAATLMARCVEGSGRFLVRELLLPRRRRAYRVRGSRATVHLEHRTPDTITLAEVWYAGVYEPPPGVAEALLRLDAEPLLVDLGANVGMFVAWLIGVRCHPRVIAYEPDPRNADLLRATLRANDPQLAGWEVRQSAAGACEREVSFLAEGSPGSRIGEGSGAVRVHCADVLPEVRDCDVLKIDVEGSEWEILRDPRFGQCGASVVVVEPHAGGDAPAHHVQGARKLLEQAGYATGVTGGSGRAAAFSVWGWRAAR